LFDLANFLKFNDLPVVADLLNIGLVVARQHYSIGILHYRSCFFDRLPFGINSEVGLISVCFNFFVKLLNLNMVRELGHALCHLSSHKNTVATIQKFLILVLPTLLLT
jgi:hypothetical protein